MARTISVAALQTSYGEDLQANIDKTIDLIRQAAARGAQVILPSELFQGPYFCVSQEERWFGTAHPWREHPCVTALQPVAAELGVSVAVIRAYLEKRSILEFLNDIKVDGARAAAVVRSLLDFTRKSEAVWSSVALAELVEASIELARKDYDLRSKFDFRKIALDVSVSPDLAPVTMVRSEIEQVLLNLFKNAAHALADKADSARAQGLEFTPRITIRARKVGAMAYLEVEDNGPGFAPEIRKRVFEPFFTTKPVGVGTGLGLWISYMILTSKHGGQLLLETSPGAGSIFTLILPFKAVVRT